MRYFAGSVCCFCVLIFYGSCVSGGHSIYDSYLASGDYTGAREQLEAHKKRLYAGTDAVLYNLDAGMLSRFAGDYDSSNKELSQAEKLIEYYYAKSISQAVGSFVLNDSVIDYAGEDYEDIYVNLFMALNYIQQQKIEDAFVEIRRFDNKLKLLASKYEQALFEAKHRAKSAKDLSFADVQTAFSSDLEFHNSAFARYISLLLYRSENRIDSALIDKKYAESAFQSQTSLYPFPLPKAIEQEFNIPEKKVRLNILHFTGLAPLKREEVFRIPNPAGGSWFKIAVPVMEKRPSNVAYIEIEALGTDGTKTTGTLELLESIENIAEDTFRQKQSLIYTKSFARALSKTVASAAVSTAVSAQDEGDGSMSAVGNLINLLSGILIETTEHADTRCSRCFPANVWVGGLNVNKGVYTVRASCYDTKGKLLHTETKEHINVADKAVTIAEFICMR